MAGPIDYFVSDSSGSRGPLSSDAARAALGATGPEARVRVEGCEPWLPAEAWEAFADLAAPAAAPVPPPEGASPSLPSELAAVAPSVRDRLMWFVADADGVMGPVSGDYIRRALAASRVAPSAGLCVVSTSTWVRASVAFPAALDAPTAVRARVVVPPCPACLEPVLPGDAVCGACGERVAPLKPPPTRLARAVVVMLAWLVVVGVASLAGWIVALSRAR